MSEDLARVRREVARCAWSRADWLPTLTVIEWAALDEARERHAKVAAEFAAAKGDAKVEAAIEALAAATQTTIDDLRERIGHTYAVASHDGNRNEFAERYAVAKQRADAANPEERATPTGARGIEEWIERDDPPDHLIEFARYRVALDDDVTAWKAFQQTVLLGPTRLVGAQILPIAACEALAAREDLDRLRVKATA